MTSVVQEHTALFRISVLVSLPPVSQWEGLTAPGGSRGVSKCAAKWQNPEEMDFPVCSSLILSVNRCWGLATCQVQVEALRIQQWAKQTNPENHGARILVGKTDHKQTRQHPGGSRGELLGQQPLGDGQCTFSSSRTDTDVTSPPGDADGLSRLSTSVGRSHGGKESIQCGDGWYQQMLKQWSPYPLHSGGAQIPMSALPLWTLWTVSPQTGQTLCVLGLLLKTGDMKSTYLIGLWGLKKMMNMKVLTGLLWWSCG